MRAARRNDRVGGDDAVQDDDDDDDEVGELKKAGMVHNVLHGTMFGEQRHELDVVQEARAATEGGMRRRVLGRGEGPPAAPAADIAADAIALLAAHHHMSSREMAEQLVGTDGMTRDTLLDSFLASKGLARS